MKKRVSMISVVLLSVLNMSAQSNPVRWEVSAGRLDGGLTQIILRADVAQGWHLYDMGPYPGGPNPTVFTFVPGAGAELVGGVEYLTAPVRGFDQMFGMKIGSFEGSASFAQKVRGPAGATVGVNVEWMCCNDRSCTPPADEDFIVTIPEEGAASDGSGIAAAASGLSAELPDGGARSSRTAGRTVWLLILEALAWGIAALVTPCVFPMVPMTVSYFIKGSENKAAGRLRATMYGLFIVLLYTVPIALVIVVTRLVGGDAVTADIFNWLATHWLPNIVFFIVFMLFAASFFGTFEIVLPSRLVNRSDRNADRKGLGGVFFMALTLVLVSFSCTGPIVGTVLIKSTSGEFWVPVVTMLAFSLAFALPFTLLALFPSWLKHLPKSGGWLNTVKVSLGFIEIALGFKFLSTADQTYHWGILSRETYLIIWIICFTLLGLYLLGALNRRRVGVPRIVAGLASLAFVAYMVPGLRGAPLKAISGYLPPLRSAVEMTEFYDLDAAEAYAEETGKPLFIDFSGLGCVNCREMEARVLTDPEIRRILRDEYVVVTLYGDDKAEAPEAQWLTTDSGKVLKTVGKINSYRMSRDYGINAQPYYILLGHGRLLAEPRAYDLDIAAFRRFLEGGLSAQKEL